MRKFLSYFLLAVVSLLSFNALAAYEDPGGTSYTVLPIVAYDYVDPVEMPATTLASRVTDNNLIDLACTVKQKGTVPISYVSDWPVASLNPAFPQRGYITPITYQF